MSDVQKFQGTISLGIGERLLPDLDSDEESKSSVNVEKFNEESQISSKLSVDSMRKESEHSAP